MFHDLLYSVRKFGKSIMRHNNNKVSTKVYISSISRVQCLALTVHFTLSCAPYVIECRKYTLYVISTQICQYSLRDIKIALYVIASYFLQGIMRKWNVCYVSKCISCVRNPKLHVIKLYWFTVCVVQRCNQQVKLSGLAIITP